MAKAKENAEREHRIAMEIVVDADGPQEQATGETRPRGPSVAGEAWGHGGRGCKGGRADWHSWVGQG